MQVKAIQNNSTNQIKKASQNNSTNQLKKASQKKSINQTKKNTQTTEPKYSMDSVDSMQ